MDIFVAARKGIDKEEFAKLIKGNASISPKDKFGQAPLHIASFEGHYDIVSLLIKKGADVDVQDKNGWTSLHCSASNGHIRICELLLKEGASPVSASTDGTTPLHYLARMPWDPILSPKVFGLALKAPVNINIVNLQEETPLHQASLRGHEDCVAYLLENGADPNLRNKQGETSLHFAIHAARIGTMRILLERGADPSISGNQGSADDLAKAVAVPGVLEAIDEARARASVRKDTKKIYLKGMANKFGGKIVKGWKKVWLVLDGLRVAYYHSETDSSPADILNLKDITSLELEEQQPTNIFINTNGSKWYLGFDDKQLVAKWLFALDGLKHKNFESSIQVDIKRDLLKSAFKNDFKGGFIKSSFDEEWMYSQDGTLECTDGWSSPIFVWDGLKLTPKSEQDIEQFGWGQFNGFLFEWHAGLQVMYRYWIEEMEREYCCDNPALTWKWTRHFLALKQGRGEWIVEGAIPEPVVFFLTLIRYRRLTLQEQKEQLLV